MKSELQKYHSSYMIGLFITLSFFLMLYQRWKQKLGIILHAEFGLNRIISIFNWQYNLLCPIISILYVYTFITNIWSWYMCWIFKLFYELVVIIIIISWGIYNTILIICNSDNCGYYQRFRLVRWILDDTNGIYDRPSFWKLNISRADLFL